jgi:lipid A ethanolaminephosphotransferase
MRAMSEATRAAPAPAARNPLRVAVWVSLWLATAANWPLWRAMRELPELAHASGGLFLLAFALMIAGLSMAVLALGAWPRIIRPLASVALLAAAAGAHFMGSYRIVIDPTMMLNVLHTDTREVRDLLGWPLLLNLALLAGLPLWLLWRTPLLRLRWSAQALRNGIAVVLALWLSGGLLVLSFAEMSSTMRNHKPLRYMVNPANSFYALGRLAWGARAGPTGPPRAIAEGLQQLPRPAGTRPPLLVLMVGETARAANFSLNGYGRVTNPETAALGVLSFTQVSACGTSTAASLPCMFSHLGREAFLARRYESENLLDLLQQAGLAVLWIDNQSGCKGLCDRVPHAAARDAPPGSAHVQGLCRDGECLDEALLTGLDQRLADLPAQRRARGVVLVMHMMGSHGPAYHKRSPAAIKPFAPECSSTALQDCRRDDVVNAYDNSIAYTDHVLARTIDWLTQRADAFDPMLLYVSDHGESLGENNLYLHGLPYAMAPPEQTRVPLLLWLPPQAAARVGAAHDCLRQRRDLALSHDHLFHTVLGLVGVHSLHRHGSLDLVEPCRAAAHAG